MSGPLNPQQRFDTLVVGASNRLAVTAAHAIAESPGAVYNPLFIYAPPGLGKTHLLMAIAHGAQQVTPGLEPEYLTLDSFVEAFTAAIAAGQGEAYRRGFSEAGLLLIDDVQFLSQRREMQAELLRIVDQMLTAGRQVVLTSDRPPSEIESLDERLIRRFAGGLVIDIGAPDYETRVAILNRKAEERHTRFGAGVLEAVARLGITNVRELVGAVNRLVAFQAVSDTPLDPTQAAVLVGGTAALADLGLDAAAPPPRRAPAEPVEEDQPAADEFGDFLSEITSTVTQQVETWRARIAAAILHWEGEGYRVGPLERLLDDVVTDPEEALRAFEAEVEHLVRLEAEAVEYAPDLAGHSAFRDPGNPAAAEQLVERAREGAHPPPGPAAHWRLDDFAEGGVNRVAVHAALAVAEEPGARYNPLVVVGRTGSGKTHLLHGVANRLAARGLVVACFSAHEFTSELIDALDRGAVTAWQARCRRVDALFLDDIHLLAGKERSQEELFLLFDLFSASGRQLAFTSVMPLSELHGVEPRLLTRMESGLVVELPPPDREVRLQVTEQMLRDKAGVTDPELAGYLAGRPAESARAVQGLVQRVLNAADVNQRAPDAALARELLEGAARPAARRMVGRSSGVVAPTGGGIRSREKVVWDWPDIAERLIEEWR